MNNTNQRIKLLVMDVDGTLTDGKIYMGIDGEVFKIFDIQDGYAIHEILPQYGIIPVVITARESKIVENRCCELGITEVYQGCKNKTEKLLELLKKYSDIISKDDQTNIRNRLRYCAYIGDDLLDLESMVPIKKMGGIIGCPANAVNDIKKMADFVSERKGGDGAVRDFVEWLIKLDSDN